MYIKEKIKDSNILSEDIALKREHLLLQSRLFDLTSKTLAESGNI